MAEVPDWVSYDPHTEQLTVDGIRFAREFFTFLARDEIGSIGRIERRSDGLVTIMRVNPKTIEVA